MPLDGLPPAGSVVYSPDGNTIIHIESYDDDDGFYGSSTQTADITCWKSDGSFIVGFGHDRQSELLREIAELNEFGATVFASMSDFRARMDITLGTSSDPVPIQ